jgi:integrase
MPALRYRVPSYRRFGKYARVSIGGRHYHLGKFDDPKARAKYDRLVGEWLVHQRSYASPEEITVKEVVKRFKLHIKERYKSRSGRQTGTRENFTPTLRLLVKVYGDTPAAKFGPVALKALRLRMVTKGLSRRSINDAASQIKQVFRFAAGDELIDERVPVRLEQVDGLRRFETAAPEPRRIKPVPDSVIDATLPHLSSVVADMVRIQRLTGARPGEIVQMRPLDIDRKGDIWRYVPREHKTEDFDVSRVICIGPEGQAILRPYLDGDPSAECFSPRMAQIGRKGRKRRKRQPGTAYTNDSYRRAITRGCELAFTMPRELRRAPAKRTGKRRAPETKEEKKAREKAAAAWRSKHCWHPHQIRHTTATEIREKFGLESARVALGHTSTRTTEIYAERDLKLAEQVARELG